MSAYGPYIPWILYSIPYVIAAIVLIWAKWKEFVASRRTNLAAQPPIFEEDVAA